MSVANTDTSTEQEKYARAQYAILKIRIGILEDNHVRHTNIKWLKSYMDKPVGSSQPWEHLSSFIDSYNKEALEKINALNRQKAEIE